MRVLIYIFILSSVIELAFANELEREPNNSALKSTTLSINQQVQGRISFLDDKDWFSIELTQPNTISITFESSDKDVSALSGWDIVIMSPNKKALFKKSITLADLNSSRGNELQIFTTKIAQSGKYYIKVSAYKFSSYAKYNEIAKARYNLTVYGKSLFFSN